MSFTSVTRKIGDREITIETGKMAKLADGAVAVKEGKNMVLVTVCMSKEKPEGIDFFPLTVNYQEKSYAAGKIPGGYIKREGRPSEKEILTSRLIDRPIRPLFPEDFYNEVQVIANVLSADQLHSTDILGIIGASAALSVSPIPFLEPAGAVRIIYKNGEFKVNPSLIESDDSQLDIVAAGTRRGLTMVEGGAKEVSKDILLKAMELAQQQINEVISLIEELAALVKPEKFALEPTVPLLSDDLKYQIREFGYPLIKKVSTNADKKSRSADIKAAYQTILDKFEITKLSETYKEAKTFIENVEIDVMRNQIIEEGTRPDGRKPDEIRPITIELDVLANVHGSALFTRGQTQSLGIVTLGSASDVQYVDTLETDEPRRFMLHYNFPPFSTGEVKKQMSTSRREIGHGHLAHRAIEGVLPAEQDFPYTIRMVSEVLESNGSSSMATVCSASLSLMSTGVPIKKQVAGIAMGLVWNKEQGKYTVLSDIQGLEDHYGDMDFKVAGSKDGITAFQMDVKTIGITHEIMDKALTQALAGKEFILNKMDTIIATPRNSLSQNAPKIKILTIPETEIGAVIGSGGRIIKRIMAETESSISIEDNGKVMISCKDDAMLEKATLIIHHIVHGFRKGDIADGVVTRIEDYGIFVELSPGQNGLLHKSQFKEKKNPRDAFKIGDVLSVKVIDIDEKKRLSITQA